MRESDEIGESSEPPVVKAFNDTGTMCSNRSPCAARCFDDGAD